MTVEPIYLTGGLVLVGDAAIQYRAEIAKAQNSPYFRSLIEQKSDTKHFSTMLKTKQELRDELERRFST